MTDYLTSDLPGTGGTLRQSPDDFAVEEIPLYLPCGSGEHLYVEIEKRGLTTHDLVRQLARACRVREREVGYAGLKDAQALTRQTLSLPGSCEGALAGVAIPGARFVSVARHRNKLRLGHLAGNRFRIRVRDVGPQARARAEAIVAMLEKRGVPNLFGEQRYGLLGTNPSVGGALLRGDFAEALRQLFGEPEKIVDPRWREGVERFRAGDPEGALQVLPRGCRNERSVLLALVGGATPEQALRRLPRPLLRLFLSAWQSQLFDRLVRQRLTTLDRLEAGDLACKHANNACFRVDDPETEQPRADRFEISPSAPLFGAKVPLAEGAPGERERKLLEEQQLSSDPFRLPGGLSLEGERRPMRVPLTDAAIHTTADDLEVVFALPRGSYATTVLREIMKPSAATIGSIAEEDGS